MQCIATFIDLIANTSPSCECHWQMLTGSNIFIFTHYNSKNPWCFISHHGYITGLFNLYNCGKIVTAILLLCRFHCHWCQRGALGEQKDIRHIVFPQNLGFGIKKKHFAWSTIHSTLARNLIDMKLSHTLSLSPV